MSDQFKVFVNYNNEDLVVTVDLYSIKRPANEFSVVRHSQETGDKHLGIFKYSKGLWSSDKQIDKSFLNSIGSAILKHQQGG